EEWAAFVTLQYRGVVADVIAREKGQHDNIREKLPDVLGERKEFLRRAIAVDPEIHHLDPLAPLIAATRKSWQHVVERLLEQLASCGLLGDLRSFNKRIPEHGDPERAAGLNARPVGSPITPSIDADQGASFISLPRCCACP